VSAIQLFVHLAWTTLNRAPMIDSATQSFLEEFFKKTAASQEVQIIEIAILKTHVHMIVRTPARIDLPRLVQFFKGGSSYRASRQPGNILGLRWAPEYSATTISPRQLENVRQYLRTQPEHHPGEAIEETVL
jgi:putative transposase